MAALPRHKVPHLKNPDGISYHNKQLIRQIPLQDSNFENVSSLQDDERHVFNGFKRERDAQMGSGKVLIADDTYVRPCLHYSIFLKIRYSRICPFLRMNASFKVFLFWWVWLNLLNSFVEAKLPDVGFIDNLCPPLKDIFNCLLVCFFKYFIYI